MRLFFLLCLVLGLAAPVSAQLTSPPPDIPLASFAFERGLQAFQRANYEEALRRFEDVLNEFPTNRSTTAAHLMAGKTLYALGRATDAAEMLRTFLDRYPSSRYVDEARYTLTQARAFAERDQRPPSVFNLGILLPTDEDSAPFTQALFNGVRLAVQAHNRANPGQPVRMIFRNSGATPDEARQAMDALARSGAEVVIGPLYSDAAEAAGSVAERNRVVMLAPMATEEEVTANHRYVFQANPTFAMRAKLMARMAVERLRHRTLGVVAQRTTYGERMAFAFREEALRLGATVPTFKLFDSARGWYELGTHLTGEEMTRLSALYLPATGEAAPTQITAALRRLSGMGGDVRALGNAEWEALEDPAVASRMSAVFTNEFYPSGSPAINEPFVRTYSDQFRRDPDRLAYAGYDITTFLMNIISRRDASTEMVDAIRRAPYFQGAGLRLHFEGGNVNEGIYYLGYRNGELVLVQ